MYKTKIYLLLAVAFFIIVFSSNVFSQQANDCPSDKQAKEGTFEVFYNYEKHQMATDIIQSEKRVIKPHELCLINENRAFKKTVYINLDEYTKVKIYPVTKLEKE